MARTIAVLGASNTGKSTLVDRMCALEGQPQPPAAPGELRVVGFTHLGEGWQAIDTPGSIEFLHVATDALLAADAAVICVGPDPAAAVLASPYLHAVEAAGTPARPLHQPHRRGDRPGSRHRRGAAGLCRASDRPAPDPDPRRRPDHRRRRSRLRARLGLPRGRAVAADRDPRGHARPRARGARRAARAPVRVRRPPARGADRGPRAAERRGLLALRPGAAREPGDGGADRLGRPRQRHRPGDEGAPPRGARRRTCCASGCRRRPGSPSRPSAVVFASAYRKHIGKTLLLRALEPLAAGRRSAAALPGSSPPPTRATATTSTRCRRA